MQQRPTVRARVMRVSLSLLVGLAAVALPLWALGPGFDGGSSDNPAATCRSGTATPRSPRCRCPPPVTCSSPAPETRSWSPSSARRTPSTTAWSASPGSPAPAPTTSRSRSASTTPRPAGPVGRRWSSTTTGPRSRTRRATPRRTPRSARAPSRPGSGRPTASRCGCSRPPGAAPEDVQVALIDGGTGLAEAPGSDSSSAQLSAASGGGIPAAPDDRHPQAVGRRPQQRVGLRHPQHRADDARDRAAPHGEQQRLHARRRPRASSGRSTCTTPSPAAGATSATTSSSTSTA